MKKSDKGIADQAGNAASLPLHVGSGDDSLNGTRTESELLHEESAENSLPHAQEEQQVFEGVADTPYARKDRNNVHGNPVARDRHSIEDTLPAADFDYTK
ncbi:hypothetical protein ACO0LO_17735 [Undibacterium sp. TJN25]|uniref:hypothetical protein n=1 Tax=Undibacterium sp. TJN25 TaxID=3413056 RepID=UPI003BF0532E